MCAEGRARRRHSGRPSCAHLASLPLLMAILGSLLVSASSNADGHPRREIDDYHYIFSADCKPYMDWQSAALFQSWRAVGSPGRITRLLSCDEQTLSTYAYLDIMPTHVTPRFDHIDPNDGYAAYNLPGSMLHFMEHNESALASKWIVKLDADMIIRKPLTVTQGGLDASPGTVAAGFYGYLVGVDNEMAAMFVEDPEARKNLAKVGGWEIFFASDLAKAAPLWFEYTKKVRTDPRAHWPFRGTGDVFITKESPRPWISEMYGYVFGTAIAGLKHNVVHSTQLYAGMSPWDDESFDPFLVHYGINVEIFAANGIDATGGTSREAMDSATHKNNILLWSWDKHRELQGGGAFTKNKLKCDVPFDSVRFPEVPGELLGDDDGVNGVDGTRNGGSNSLKLTRSNGEARRVRVVHELMKALNEGVLAYRERACGEATESHALGGKASTVKNEPHASGTSGTSVTVKKPQPKLPRRLGSGEGDTQGVVSTPVDTSTESVEIPEDSDLPSEIVHAKTNDSSQLLLSAKTPPTSVTEQNELRNVWVLVSFVWGAVFVWVCVVFWGKYCRRRTRGGNVVRQRVGWV